ncbi:hypothetical protein [Micromonospora sp. NPDC048898]|uniref:hypothetical protein n=1 Tax=Micromonospora sp. NPDC048898 TaxID=3364260 RepID=UPI003713A72E
MATGTTDHSQADPSTPAPPEPPGAVRRMLLAPVVIGLFLVIAFAGLMIPALRDPVPHDVPLGVVGPPPAVAQISQRLEERVPGAFEVETFSSVEQARDALRRQDVLGAIVLAQSGPPSLLVAGAAGDAPRQGVTTAFQAIAQAAGGAGPIEDVAPLPGNDSRGLSGVLLCIALVVGALLFQATLALLAGRRPARDRLLLGFAYAVVSGVIGAVLAGPVIGALEGNFAALLGISILLSLTVVGVVAACQTVFGILGVALAALVVLPLGVSSSGGPVEQHFLPAFHAAVSQYLPMGSSVTLLRRVLYFDGLNISAPLLTLAAWAVAAWIVFLVVERIRPYRPVLVLVPASAVPAVAGGVPQR